jgi:alanine dehydrogenase
VNPIKVLVISEEEASSLLTVEETLEAVELAFKEGARGYAQMPPKVYLNYHGYKGDLRTMPAYLERLDISVVKVVSVYPENGKKFGLPTVMATILLTDPKNGQLLAVMGGGSITAMRTGAAGGIAAKYLAVKNPKTVSFIGAGFQARTQFSALLSVYPNLQEIKVWDIKLEAARAFAAEIACKTSMLHAVAVETPQATVADADIVVTTTPSTKPLIMNEWVQNGTHFNCIGADAPGKEELDPAILRRSKIVIDDWMQASHSGEINVPVSRGILFREDVWAELGEVVTGIKAGRSSENEITVFDSTGLAIQDAATAELLYRKALEKKVGSYINL